MHFESQNVLNEGTGQLYLTFSKEWDLQFNFINLEVFSYLNVGSTTHIK